MIKYFVLLINLMSFIYNILCTLELVNEINNNHRFDLFLFSSIRGGRLLGVIWFLSVGINFWKN
jgi:hypothetical protein